MYTWPLRGLANQGAPSLTLVEVVHELLVYRALERAFQGVEQHPAQLLHVVLLEGILFCGGGEKIGKRGDRRDACAPERKRERQREREEWRRKNIKYFARTSIFPLKLTSCTIILKSVDKWNVFHVLLYS